MLPAPYTFKNLDLGGLKTLVDWAAQEGWNPGPQDAEVFWHTDPEGFYGIFLADTLIAGGAIISYNGEFGFMGLFIVKPEFRGQGLGRKLWYHRRDLLLQRLQPGAAIGMDGVVSMQPFYHKGGFDIAFTDKRYEKIGQAMEVAKAISPINQIDFPAILAYDKSCFGFSRPQFLERWLTLRDSQTFMYMVDEQLQGFAVMRKVLAGYKIGPLFADNDLAAEALYCACLNAVAGQKVYLDIPTTNLGAVTLVNKYGASYVFECARMYYNAAPAVSIDKVYGITTFELG